MGTKKPTRPFASYLKDKRADPLAAVKQFSEALSDETFWEQLFSGAAPEGSPDENRTHAPSGDATSDIITSELERFGVTRVDHWLPDSVARQCSDVVARLVDLGFPASAIMLCSPFWEAFSSDAIKERIKVIYPQGWSISMRLNLTVVQKSNEERTALGWRPHIDARKPPRLLPSGIPERISFWTAITPAPADASCIHITPKGILPGQAKALLETEQLENIDVMRMLHHVQALPCSRGSSLIWAPDLLHWGGPFTSSVQERRISWLMEIVSKDAKQFVGEPAFFPLDERIPSYEERLQIWATHIQKLYGFAEVGQQLSPFVPVAQRITG